MTGAAGAARYEWAGLKERRRAEEKLARCYGGDVTRICDVVRQVLARRGTRVPIVRAVFSPLTPIQSLATRSLTPRPLNPPPPRPPPRAGGKAKFVHDSRALPLSPIATPKLCRADCARSLSQITPSLPLGFRTPFRALRFSLSARSHNCALTLSSSPSSLCVKIDPQHARTHARTHELSNSRSHTHSLTHLLSSSSFSLFLVSETITHTHTDQNIVFEGPDDIAACLRCARVRARARNSKGGGRQRGRGAIRVHEQAAARGLAAYRRSEAVTGAWPGCGMRRDACGLENTRARGVRRGRRGLGFSLRYSGFSLR